MKRALTIAMAAAAAIAAPSSASAQAPVSANLDADPAAEQVVLVRVRCRVFGRTRPCQRVAVRDGATTAPVSPPAERFGRPEVRDLQGDGIGEIVFAGSSGQGGAAPATLGVASWTGAAGRPLLTYRSKRGVAGARLAFEDDGGARTPGQEVVLVEGILRRGEPHCCPSRRRFTSYKSAGGALAPYLRGTVGRGEFLSIDRAEAETFDVIEKLYLNTSATGFASGACSRRGPRTADCSYVLESTSSVTGESRGNCRGVLRLTIDSYTRRLGHTFLSRQNVGCPRAPDLSAP